MIEEEPGSDAGTPSEATPGRPTEPPAPAAPPATAAEPAAPGEPVIPRQPVVPGEPLRGPEAIDPRKGIGRLSDRSPLVLLPVRIETRFVHGGTDEESGHELWVRIYPDDCSIDTFEADALRHGGRERQALLAAHLARRRRRRRRTRRVARPGRRARLRASGLHRRHLRAREPAPNDR